VTAWQAWRAFPSAAVTTLAVPRRGCGCSWRVTDGGPTQFRSLIAVTVVAVLTPATSTAGPSGHHAASRSSVVSPQVVARSTPATAAAPLQQIELEPDTSSCLTNTAAKFVLVSLSQQHVWMCQDHLQVRSGATPTGSWLVQSRETNRFLTGPGYREYVHYWVPSNCDFGFHDATWQTLPFGSQDYRTEGSHGCVHLPLAAMACPYRWAPDASFSHCSQVGAPLKRTASPATCPSSGVDNRCHYEFQ
jgi:hypothetical protein